jgi:hypothetical protein
VPKVKSNRGSSPFGVMIVRITASSNTRAASNIRLGRSYTTKKNFSHFDKIYFAVENGAQSARRIRLSLIVAVLATRGT